MLRGIQLELSLGPVPRLVPPRVLDALVSAKIDAGAGSAQSGFELVFEFGAHSALHSLFLATSGLASTVLPFVRVVLVAVINGRAEPLMDGVITTVSSVPTESGGVRITLWGKDLSALMDREEIRGASFAGQAPWLRALSVLKKYAALGIVPVVIPTLFDLPALPSDHIPQQHGTDYTYLSQLAADVGYVFYVDSAQVIDAIAKRATGPAASALGGASSSIAGAAMSSGFSKAYWGPELRVGWPQPALTTGMDALNTVEELSFSFDREQSETPAVYWELPLVHRTISVPIPSVTPLDPPLGAIPPLPAKLVHLPEMPNRSLGHALLRGMAHAANRSHALTGSGRLDVTRYGRVLRSRQLVGVRGAGLPYDGLHYVTRVNHEITRGSYLQSFELSRNGLFPTVPRVPV